MTGLKAGLAIIIAVRETTQVPGPASSHLWKSITLVFHVKQARNPDGTKRYPGTLSVRHARPRIALRFIRATTLGQPPDVSRETQAMEQALVLH